MGSLGAPELFLIALIALIVFGTGRLPDLGRGLGEGIRNFKLAIRDGERPDPKPSAGEGTTSAAAATEGAVPTEGPVPGSEK